MREKLSAPSMPVLCAKYLGGTKHLTLEQHGAMMLLLMITWENDGEPIRDDPSLISRYLSITKDRWLSKIRPELAPLFDLSEGTWKAIKPLNLGKQWAYVQDQIAVRQKNGRESRGRPPAIKFDEVSGNFSAPTHEKITETQTANPLINNNVVKAPGYVPGNRDETYININIKKEESKKESPLTPQGGDVWDLKQIPDEARGEAQEDSHEREMISSETVYKSPEPGQMLFPDEDGQTGKARKSRGPETRQIDEAFAAFMEAYPDRDKPHSVKGAKRIFAAALKRKVDPAAIVSGAARYCQQSKIDRHFGTKYVKDAYNWLNEVKWEDYSGIHQFPGNQQEARTEEPYRFRGDKNTPPVGYDNDPPGTKKGWWIKSSQGWMRYAS